MVSFVLILGACMVLTFFVISVIAAVFIFRAARRGRPVRGGRYHHSRHSDGGPFYYSSYGDGHDSDDHQHWGDSNDSGGGWGSDSGGGGGWGGDSGGGGGDSGGGGGGGD